MYIDFSNDKIQEIYKKFKSCNFHWTYDSFKDDYFINGLFCISKTYNSKYDGILYMDEYFTILKIGDITIETSIDLYDCFMKNKNEANTNLSLNKILDSFQ